MIILTKEIKEKLVDNHKQQNGEKEFKAVVKLFNPIGKGTWYLSELNPETNIAFGLCCLDYKEFGYVSLDELTDLRIAYRPVLEGNGNNRIICPTIYYKIERDKFFKSNKYTLNECESL